MRDLWSKLVSAVSGDENEVRADWVLENARKWLLSNLEVFSKEEINSYGLEFWSKISISDFVIDSTEFDASTEVRQLRAVPPSSKDTVAMRVRDLFWNALVPKSDVLCPNCESDDLRILKVENQPQLAYACDICGYAQDKNGHRRSDGGRLIPATKRELEQYGAEGS
ncbi:MAG TPA: hypothetical protein VK539_28105 [Myxococcaceae bacterium]|nr:hypothetical protein [Myxococcaceae bacterium]